MERTEFGARRTSCTCEVCVTNCRHMPGYLIPADLTRMIPLECNKCRRPMKGSTAYDGACECGGLIRTVDPFVWAEQNLLASPGALVARVGKTFRIPTLVPAVKEDGSCIHLSEEGLCQIHATAPFGCAFFDCGEEPPDINHKALVEVYEAHQGQNLYHQIWIHLCYKGLTQESADILRSRMP